MVNSRTASRIVLAGALFGCSGNSTGIGNPNGGGNGNEAGADGDTSPDAEAETADAGALPDSNGSEAAAPQVTPTLLVDNVPFIVGLTVAGSNLFWIDGAFTAGGAIRSVPISGGTPKTIYSSPRLAGDLATDGQELYFTVGDPNDSSSADIESISFDGMDTEGTPGANGVAGPVLLGSHSRASEIFVAGGNVYFFNFNGVYSVSVNGGMPSIVVHAPANGAVNELLGLVGNVYYAYTTSTGGPTLFGCSPVASSASAQLFVTPPTNPNANAGWGGDFAVIDLPQVGVPETAYFLANAGSNAALWKAASPSGPGASVVSYAGETATALIGDNQGLYALLTGTHAGLYAIDPSVGTQTLVTTNNGDIGSLAVLDATSVYFMGSAGLYSVPR